MHIFSRGLSNLSTVHKGSAFERRSLQLLQDHFSMLLRRVGGKSDGGIDLVGWWWLPVPSTDILPCSDGASKLKSSSIDLDSLPRRRLRVLAQCKAEKKKVGPSYVREMEGVWHARAHTQSHFHYSHPLESRRDTSPAPAKDMFERIPEENHPPQCVALLISESPFTQTTLRRAFSSTVPLLLLYLPPYTPNTAAGLLSDPILPPPTFPVIGAAYPNPTLAQLTAPLEIRWERPNHLEDAPMSAGCGRPGLWLDGQRISSWIN